MKAHDFIKSIEFLPCSAEGDFKGRPSNSELRRWLNNRSVIINNTKPMPDEEINLPIASLIFFPKGSRKTTMW